MIGMNEIFIPNSVLSIHSWNLGMIGNDWERLDFSEFEFLVLLALNSDPKTRWVLTDYEGIFVGLFFQLRQLA